MKKSPQFQVASLVLACALLSATSAHAAYDVTIVSSGASSNGAWVGNTWAPNANGSTVLASEVATHLANGPTAIVTAGGGTDPGDITVNAAVSWSANTFTLTASHSITIAAALTGTATAKLALEYGQGAVAAGNTAVYRITTAVSLDSAPVSLPLPPAINPPRPWHPIPTPRAPSAPSGAAMAVSSNAPSPFAR